ncbi:MAG: SDR family NAD(P)-dependent oxidoreductase [Bacilli bacterium]|nr:SDR family NAD(P)-dependent oxidoreductase [Bacilli bacterium]
MNVLITGAASGIGYNVGLRLAKMGYHVFLTTEDDKQLEVLREKIDELDNIGTFRLNVEKKEDIELLRDFDVDVLISNAAIGQGGSLIDVEMEKIKECFNVNVFSNISIMKIVLENMIKKGSGKVIIMSSMISNIAIPFFGIYASTKASLSMLGGCLRKELKYINNNIKLAIIEPGIYKTGFNRVMIENGYTSKYYKFNESVENLEKEILNFVGSNNLNSISNKIIEAVESDNPKCIYRAPFIQNLLIKLYIKFIKK